MKIAASIWAKRGASFLFVPMYPRQFEFLRVPRKGLLFVHTECRRFLDAADLVEACQAKTPFRAGLVARHFTVSLCQGRMG